jgi:hypothetical protein
MTIRKHVVVDGSNIATEGRERPSLKQLDEAVRAFLTEHPTEHVNVVVDATFGHRIPEEERPAYEQAVLAGELIAPPAGVIGRGDAFVLEIADRADATVLSNDSFQEFHGQYPWLFDEGRLIGGKPVPGVGWVFLLRTPVRGPVSRKAVRDARNGRGGRPRKGREPHDRPTEPTGESQKRRTAEASRRVPATKRRAKPSEPVNELLPFVEFVAKHAVGTAVRGRVEQFSSHGAYVSAGGARCYVPLKLMGDPAPRSAREVLKLGEERTFVVYSIDPPRRGIDLALAVERTAHADTGSPAALDEPAKHVGSAAVTRQDGGTGAADRTSSTAEAAEEADAEGAKKAPTTAAAVATTSSEDQHAEEAPVSPAAKKTTTRTAATKNAATKATSTKAPAKRTTAKKTTAKKTTATKAPAKKTTAKKTTATKAPAKKTAAKKTTATKAPAKKTAARAR